MLYIEISTKSWYYYSMSTEYRRTATTVSFLCYHFVFCPRYRRKIFLIPGVEDRFKELTRRGCEKEGFDILTMECEADHVHLLLKCGPEQSPTEIMHIVKGFSSRELRNEFPELAAMPSLWTRNYFASTAGNVSAAAIRRYVETQKNRP